IVLAIVLAWNVREQAIGLRAAYASVVAKIDSGELVTARTLLTPHLEDSDASSWQVLDRTLKATEKLEDLLDLVQGRVEDALATDLQAAIDIEEAVLPLHRVRDLRLAKSLALALAGEKAAAEQVLLALP